MCGSFLFVLMFFDIKKKIKEMNKIDLLKGRVITSHYTKYIVEYLDKIYTLEVSGRFKYIAFKKSDYPVVGDYVYFNETNELEGMIEKVETRRNVLSRLSTNAKFDEQIIASNIDLVFICVSLNEDFNVKKILNFISMTNGDYHKILLFTKSDLVKDYVYYKNEILKYIDIPILSVSMYQQGDVNAVKEYIKDKTAVFIGSSGVGKSTLINKMIEKEVLETKEIRVSDAQGRHTTTHKELFHLDNEGSIIDSPGIRIINSYYSDDLSNDFSDVYYYANQCKFRDCTHDKEPGCKVREALETGDLSQLRFDQYQKVLKYNNHVKRAEITQQKIFLHKRQKKIY